MIIAAIEPWTNLVEMHKRQSSKSGVKRSITIAVNQSLTSSIDHTLMIHLFFLCLQFACQRLIERYSAFSTWPFRDYFGRRDSVHSTTNSVDRNTTTRLVCQSLINLTAPATTVRSVRYYVDHDTTAAVVSVAQLVARWTQDRKVVGSIPTNAVCFTVVR